MELFVNLFPGPRIAVLINPADPEMPTHGERHEPAAQANGLEIQFSMPAPSRRSMRPLPLSGATDPTPSTSDNDSFLVGRRVRLAQLAARYMVPAYIRGANFPMLAD